MAWTHVNRTPHDNARNKKAAQNRRDLINRYLGEKTMTKRYFADAAGISQTTFSRFMSGTMQTGSFAYSKSLTYMKANK